jgi:glycine/D-amino acid oxidase-like deaminating enzyme
MAYYLAKKGRDVALVERHYLASEASGANGGLLDAYGPLPYADHDKYRYGQIAEQGRVGAGRHDGGGRAGRDGP